MAHQCRRCGLCCQLFLINLNEVEYRSGKYKTIFEEFGIFEDFTTARKNGVNLLAQKDDGSCIYLGNGYCQIHDLRPQVCRNFFCTSKSRQFQKMIRIINVKRVIVDHKNNILKG